MPTSISTAHKHFEVVLSALGDAAALTDTAGLLVATNQKFDETLSEHGPPPIAKPISTLLKGLAASSFSAFLETCGQAADQTTPDFHCNVDIGSLALNFVLSPLYLDGGFVGLLVRATTVDHSDDVKLQFLMEHIDQGVWDYNTRTREFIVSESWLQMRGMKRGQEINSDARTWLDDIHPEDRDALRKVFERQTSGGGASVSIQYRRKHADGHWFWIMCNSKVMAVDKNGMPTRIVGTDTDITALRQNEEEMAQMAEKLRLAIDASGIGIWEFDPNSGQVFWDDTMLDIYGITDGQNNRCGELWETHLHPDDLADTVAYAQHCQKNGLDFRRDYRVIHQNGETRHIRSRASQVQVPGGLPKLIGANIDVTEDYERAKELEQAQAQLLHDSRHDALTGLANRRLLDETADFAFDNMGHDQTYAVLHLDLDFFKSVNDTHGHAAGDLVLIAVAQRLKDIIADSGLVGRMGGDEFAVFFETAPDLGTINQLCREIITTVAKPISYESTHCTVGVSIGCAFGLGSTENHAQVFIQADRALYAAKSAGRNCYRVHTIGSAVA